MKEGRNGVCEGSNANLCGNILPTVIKRELPLAVIVNKVKKEGGVSWNGVHEGSNSQRIDILCGIVSPM